MSIVVMGTVALDSVKTPCGERDNQLGGSAAHFAMSARLFCPVHLCAVIGKDFPPKHLAFFRKLGINIDGLAVKDGCTFRWKGEYPAHDLNSANTLHTELGVITTCVPQICAHHHNTRNVFLANYDPDVQQAFLDQFKKPGFVGMDTMNLWINTKKKSLTRLIKQVDLLIVNDSEAKAFTDERNLLKAAKRSPAWGRTW
jgi:Sugar kinases, ribokinase family